MTEANASTPELIPVELLRSSYLEQAALTQLHRWLSLWDGKDAPRARGRDALSDDLILTFDGGELANSADNVMQIDAVGGDYDLRLFGSSNPAVVSQPGEPLIVELDVALGSPTRKRLATLRAEFDAGEDIDIKIRALHYADLREEAPLAFKACASRILTVNHRWHALVETPDKSPEPFREIVSPSFAMEFGHGAVRSFEELSAWVEGSASSVLAPRHDLRSFQAESIGDGRAKAVFVLDWQGLTRDDERILAQTRHTWTMRDVPDARYPLIEHIDVEFLTPFTVVDRAHSPFHSGKLGQC